MEHIDWNKVQEFLFVTLPALIYLVKKWTDYIEAVLKPVIEDLEQRAKDGTIDKDDRKALAMDIVNILEQQKKIKLNFITRFIVGKVVDDIAQRLPDFQISKEAQGLVASAIQNQQQVQ